MYQLYGLDTNKVIVPIGAYPNTANKGAPLQTMEVAYPNDIYRRLEASAALGVGAQVFEQAAFPAGYIYELYSIAFYYVGGTCTISKILIHSGVQTFVLAGVAALAANVALVWNGKIYCAAADLVRCEVQVTVAGAVIWVSALGYRKILTT